MQLGCISMGRMQPPDWQIQRLRAWTCESRPSAWTTDGALPQSGDTSVKERFPLWNFDILSRGNYTADVLARG